MAKHAFLSASGAPAWSRCEAKVWREKDLPDETSVFAAEGTLAHKLLDSAIKWGRPASFFKGYPDDMCEHIQGVIDYIEAQEFDQVFAEQRLDISFITGEEGACGTADVVGIKGDTITVIDLKYGMGVKVEAEGNEQLAIYGAAALREFDLVGDITKIKLVICQPRLYSTTECLLTIGQLSEMIDALTTKAKRILTAKGGDTHLRAVPGDKQCQFCTVRDDCPERNGLALTTVVNDVVDLEKKEEFLDNVADAVVKISTKDDRHLATCMEAVNLIESWCAGVRREVEKRLQNDNFSDHRWKLVQGRSGHRKIVNETDLISLAKDHGIDSNTLYEAKLASVPELEKAHKKAHPVFWAKVEALLTRPDGKPVVVPAGDKRPALNLALDFKPIEDDYIDATLGLTIEGPS